jgi:LysM repeat protein
MNQAVSRVRLLAALLFAVLFAFQVGTASAATTHTVQPGETLSGIAEEYGVSVQALASANGIQPNAWVYAGQTLTIPGNGNSGGTPPSAPSTGGTYTVKAGDTLYGIAAAHRTTVQAIKTANNLNSDIIYVGQRLTIPGGGSATPPNPGTGGSNPGVNGAKWIDVNVTTQTITAYEGNTAVYSAVVSTGLPRTPTVIGTYKIYVKYRYTDMQGGSYAAGDYYYLRDVPYTMYFFRGYGIHGTYWHNNFGQPMSHGCVNLKTSDAEWFFNWAPVGTTVVTHY